jgi:hypothetical protein
LSLTPVKLLDGIGVFKGRIRRNADAYQVDIATPLDRSFDEDAGGDEDNKLDLLDSSESDDDLVPVLPRSSFHLRVTITMPDLENI